MDRIKGIFRGAGDFLRKAPIASSLMLACAVGIAVTTAVVGENALTTAPLYVSLLIGVLMSTANRYANLLGSINCIFYTIVYIYFGLYAQAAQALLVSCPLQMITFIRWNRRAYKSSTEFRSLGAWRLVAILGASVLAYALIMLLLNATDASYPYLDNAITVLSTAQTVLALLSFREFTWFGVPVCVLLVVLDIVMIPASPIRIAYLIYSVHALICGVRQFISVQRIYKEQGLAAAADAAGIPSPKDPLC